MTEHIISIGEPTKALAAPYSRFVFPFVYRLLTKTDNFESFEFEYRRMCTSRADCITGNKVHRSAILISFWATTFSLVIDPTR